MSDQTQTIRVHQYAECSEEEADKSGHGVLCYYHGDGRAVFCYTYGKPKPEAIPVRYLGCVERPAPPKPKERVVYRFEEVAEPEAGENGWRWYAQHDGKISAYRRTPPPACAVRHHLRRTVERIAVEPEKWAGTARVVDCIGLFFCKARAGRDYTDPLHVQVTGENHPTREQAEADLPILRDLAEQYAAHHGARVEWKEAGA